MLIFPDGQVYKPLSKNEKKREKTIKLAMKTETFAAVDSYYLNNLKNRFRKKKLSHFFHEFISV